MAITCPFFRELVFSSTSGPMQSSALRTCRKLKMHSTDSRRLIFPGYTERQLHCQEALQPANIFDPSSRHTSVPKSSDSRGTTGVSLNLSSGPSLGLPCILSAPLSVDVWPDFWKSRHAAKTVLQPYSPESNASRLLLSKAALLVQDNDVYEVILVFLTRWDVSKTLAPFSTCRIDQRCIMEVYNENLGISKCAGRSVACLLCLLTKYLSVGTAARIRVSSVIFWLLSSGTFRSARTYKIADSASAMHGRTLMTEVLESKLFTVLKCNVRKHTDKHSQHFDKYFNRTEKVQFMISILPNTLV